MSSRYVVVRNSDGLYVASDKLQLESSYTVKLEEAAVYATEKAAKANCCSDERVVLLDSLLQKGK